MIKRVIDKLRENITGLTIIFVFWVFCFNKWQKVTEFNDKWIEALAHPPSAYRLWTQFLALFDQHPIAFVALVSITFASVATILYLLCPEKEKPILAAFLILVMWGSSIRQAPVFLVLAVAILLKNRDWSILMVIPMTMIKEHSGLIYVIYLVSTKKYKKAVIAGILWAITFVSIRVIIGPRDWYIPEDPTYLVTTPILTLDPYILRLGPEKWMNWIKLAGDISLTIFLVKNRKEAFIFIANLPIIIIFGLFYESQLWLMPAIAVIFSRRNKNEHNNNGNNILEISN